MTTKDEKIKALEAELEELRQKEKERELEAKIEAKLRKEYDDRYNVLEKATKDKDSDDTMYYILAFSGLGLGILSYFVLGIPFAILAIILSLIPMTKSKNKAILAVSAIALVVACIGLFIAVLGIMLGSLALNDIMNQVNK